VAGRRYRSSQVALLESFVSEELARAKLDLYLGAWRRLHPGVFVSLVD
jgi:hypothetical protein